MEKINFSQNWNKKLNCRAFTTIRKPSEKYIHGQDYAIYLNGVLIKECKLVVLESVTTKTITEREARLDTGYCKNEFLEILSKMYNPLPVNMYILTLLTVKDYPEARIQLFEAEIRKLTDDMLKLKKS